MQFPLLLREALPYLQAFHGKTFIVKTGGKVIDDMDFPQLIHDIATLKFLGIRILLVLGSGPQFDLELGKRKIPFEKINGLRVTTPEMIAVLREITAAQMEDIRQRFAEHHINTVHANQFLHAEQMHAEGFPEGHRVGRVTQVDTTAIGALLDGAFLPVFFSSVREYNCNADDVTLEIAKAFAAEKVLFLTGSKGIFISNSENSASELLSSATPEEIEHHIATGGISGGMIPKALAAAAVVKAGIPKAHIVSGLLDGSLLLEVFTHHGTGTMIAEHISPEER